MTEERKKILEMLAAGKISPEDAARLFDKLENSAGSGGQGTAAPNAGGNAAADPLAGAKRPRYLRIQVERPGRGDINLRVPLSMARGGRHWMAFLPSRVSEKLCEHGIDWGSIDKMSDEDFQNALDQMNIDIESESGKKIRIYAE